MSIPGNQSGAASASGDGTSVAGLPGGKALRGAAHTAAGAIRSTAGHVRDYDMKGMWADVMKLIKRNPGIALLTAAAVGFLFARRFSRD